MLSVPGGGATTVGAGVDVVDMVLEVVCAKAAPVIKSKAPALAIRYFFIGVLQHFLANNGTPCCIGNAGSVVRSADMGRGDAVFQVRKLLMAPYRKI